MSTILHSLLSFSHMTMSGLLCLTAGTVMMCMSHQISRSSLPHIGGGIMF